MNLSHVCLLLRWSSGQQMASFLVEMKRGGPRIGGRPPRGGSNRVASETWWKPLREIDAEPLGHGSKRPFELQNHVVSCILLAVTRLRTPALPGVNPEA